MNFGENLIDWLTISPTGALSVVVSTSVMYFLFLLVARVTGHRILTGMSSFDLAATLVVGAIVGRTTLGPVPTLAAGIIAFFTLLALQLTMGKLAHSELGYRVFSNQPILLITDGDVLYENLKKTHLNESELRIKLRGVGVTAMRDLAAVILEPTGSLSVLRSGPISTHMLDGVTGREKIPTHLLRDERRPEDQSSTHA